jgi:recombination protein RecR
VVEQPTDVIPLERTGAYHGLYHVLGGRLSPLDNIHPENLRISQLERRLASGTVREIILAVGSDVEGEATAHYLGDMLAHRTTGAAPLTVSRLAQGLPAGGGLDHADDLTLHRALSGRRLV